MDIQFFLNDNLSQTKKLDHIKLKIHTQPYLFSKKLKPWMVTHTVKRDTLLSWSWSPNSFKFYMSESNEYGLFRDNYS